MFEIKAARLPLPPRAQEEAAHFGAAVATDGHRVVVGAPAHDLRRGLRRRADAGVVYVYEGSGLDWALVQELEPHHPGRAAFGQAVAIDGHTIVVGSPLAAGAQGPLAGTVEVFERDPRDPDGRFRTVAVLQADGQGELGSAVAVQPRMIAAGAPYQRVGVEELQPAAGAVHLYEAGPAERGGRLVPPGRSARAWTRGPSVSSQLSGLAAGCFGAHLALSGSRLLASEEWCAERGHLARVFALEAEHWVDEALLVAAPELLRRIATGPRAVALEGDLAVVGIPTTRAGELSEVGAVQVHRRAGRTWQLAAVLQPPVEERVADLRFGQSVALAGGRIIVGAPGWGDRSRRTGATWFYAPDEHGWQPVHRYVPTHAGTGDDRDPARFGAAVAARGGLAVVGAPGWDTGEDPLVEVPDAGAAWVFTLG